MFKAIRYRIANYYSKKALKETNKGDFKSIMRGLDYLKKSISIVPPSEELKRFGEKWRNMVEEEKTKIEKN